MNPKDFKRILLSFADNTKDILLDKNDIVIQIRDEVITITLFQEGTELIVFENGEKFIAGNWIVTRLAKLPQLAERILEYVKNEEFFVDPGGIVNKELDKNPEDDEQDIEKVSESLYELLDSREALASKVIYITSDAGEGKSTIINELARKQAQKFKDKKSQWLILPIQLGGRPFLRFDDLIIASLVNKYRFPNFYFDSLIELIKLGVIVLALDGFEEMFMESSGGEAISALGQLMNKLDSQGSVVVAARKAYFDFKNLSLQAKLFDTISSNQIYFSRLKINRWEQKHFLDYAKKRNYPKGPVLYETLKRKLGSNDHSILTRAVLIKQLFEIFSDEIEIINTVERLFDNEIDNYFSNFVTQILKREAETKWIDRSGEAAKPLIEITEHEEILALIAQEMWLDNTDFLRDEILDFLIDLYAELKGKPPAITRQLKERIKQHALIINSSSSPNSFSFDHEEFKNYFLGLAIASKILKLNDLENSTLIQILQIGNFPYITLQTIIQKLKKENFNIAKIVNQYTLFSKNESQSSFIRENLSILILKYITALGLENITLNSLVLPNDSLCNVKLSNIKIEDSYFQNTRTQHSIISKCSFVKCIFDRLEKSINCTLLQNQIIDSRLDCLYDEIEDHSYFDPKMISSKLYAYGFEVIENNNVTQDKEIYNTDSGIILMEKLIRRFAKSTSINENILRLKLGQKYNEFEKDIFPLLIEKNILIEIDYTGAGSQRRYKLGKPMVLLTNALEKSKGNFEKFINLI